jgi:hypothetical protein
MSTTYEEYIDFLSKTKWYAHADQNDTGELAYHALGLAGEGGEFVDLVKKIVRDFGYDAHLGELAAPLRLRLIDELGDVRWYFTQLQTLLGITDDQLMQVNMNKLKAREANDGEGRQHVC